MLIPHGTIILVVDGSRMKLLRNCGRDSAPKLEVLEERSLHNAPDRQLASAPPGRSFQSVGPSRSAYEVVSRHERREDEFASEALDALEEASVGAPVILIAPPDMLGGLRRRLSARLRTNILAELPKDLTHLAAQDLADHLQRDPEEA